MRLKTQYLNVIRKLRNNNSTSKPPPPNHLRKAFKSKLLAKKTLSRLINKFKSLRSSAQSKR